MPTTRAKTTRPSNRKQQIVAAASEQFRRSGYHNVSMADIAETVGISGPALYRHFSNKRAILNAALVSTIDQATVAFCQDYEDLPAMLNAFARVLIERQEGGIVSERILANLPPDERQELRKRYVAGLEPLRAAIARSRPDLTPDTVELLMRTALAAFRPMGLVGSKLGPAHVHAHGLIVDVGRRIFEIDSLPKDVPGIDEIPQLPRDRLMPASRREAVLAAASRLFASRGYESVGMEDIASAAGGMAGPSLYHHFPSKSAILVATVTRCLEAMLFDMSAALSLSESSEQALTAALASFVRINFEHGPAMTTLLNDVMNLPEKDREIIRRGQRDYLSEWAALLADYRPELPLEDARLIVQGVHAAVAELGQHNSAWMRPARRSEIIAMGWAMLESPTAP